MPSVLLVDDLDSKVSYILKDLNKRKLVLHVHPYIAAFITKGFKSLRNQWFFKFLKWVKVEPDSSLSFLEYHFFDEDLEEIIL